MRTAAVLIVAASIVAVVVRFDYPRLASRVAAAQGSGAIADPSRDPVYICPMDPDVRSSKPGVCRRCGMNLVAGVPDPVEFHLDLAVSPDPPQPHQPTNLTFIVHDPWKDRPVNKYVIVHERLFHAFVVSQDLKFFQHGHPVLAGDGEFQYPVTLPGGGMYRVLGDFYPEGATPQLITETLFVPGTPPGPPSLGRDYSTKQSENAAVSLEVLPAQPVAGSRTQMTFTVAPGEGLEKYLGAWAHMLAASDDLIDMMHQHPFRADGSPTIQFNVVFPRAKAYRVWVQFQRHGVVNTVHFDVPVEPQPAS